MVQAKSGGGHEDVGSQHDVRTWPKGMSGKRVSQIKVGNNRQASTHGNSNACGGNGYAFRIMDRGA
jgi:hypothetical protein